MPQALLSWSGGKDSALSLFEAKRTGTFDLVALLTTVTRDFDRVSMHGVRRTLLEKQAEMVGLPVEKVWITKGVGNAEYEAQMRGCLEKYRANGVGEVIFGDLFLEDIRQYRERQLSKIGMKGIFPLWGRDTARLARTFIDSGFKAVVCTVDPKVLDRKFCGAEFADLLEELPPGVDPCGENGEFHTFVYDGPIFRKRIEVRVGEVVLREGFYFADVLPAWSGGAEGGIGDRVVGTEGP
jgi:uncharacterized protein (TIGR00290 family)